MRPIITSILVFSILILKGQDIRINKNEEFAIQLLNEILNNEKFILEKNEFINSNEKLNYIIFKTTTTNFNQFRGKGIVINKIDKNELKPIWLYFDQSDFPPHKIELVDFNNDSKKDLFLLSGQEDVYYTAILINEIYELQFDSKNYRIKYENHNSYSTICDLNKDRKPEILHSLNDTEFGYLASEYLNTLNKNEIEKYYSEILGEFANLNFKYGRDSFYPWNVKIYDKIEIFGYKNDSIENITNEFSDFINWRIQILNKILSDSINIGKINKNRIEELIEYYDKKF